MAQSFGITLKELRELMECRRQEAVDQVKAYGGMTELCRKLKSSPVTGLPGDKADLDMRRDVYGENLIPPKKPKIFFILVLEAVQDFTLIALIIAALVSLALWLYTYLSKKEDVNTASNESDDDSTGWIDSVAILISVVVVVFVSAGNDWQKEKQFRKLQKQIDGDHNFAVIRNGEAVNVNVADIVVGDVCQVKYGDLIPADGILIASNDLKIDEASLTGESDHVKKIEGVDPMILSGTHVMEGSGKMIVTAVGVNSQSGVIFTLLSGVGKNKKKKCREAKKQKKKTKVSSEDQGSLLPGSRPVDASQAKVEEAEKEEEEDKEDKEEDIGGMERSVLQKKLKKMALMIGYFGAVAAVATMLVMLTKFCVRKYGYQKAQFHVGHFRHYVTCVITGITVMVVAIPEGLPLAVTLSLIFACKKMMKDHNLVRHLDACETMGSATAICSDKTGTLTTNRMTVVRSYICGNLTADLPKYNDLPAYIADVLIHAISLNCAYTSRTLPSETPGELPTQVGNKTECALLGFVRDLGKSYMEIRERHPEESFTRVYTFNSVRKSMSTVIPREGGGFRLFTKGASEFIMKKCAWIYGKEGKLERFTKEMQDRLVTDVIEPMASDSLRTISIAYKDFVTGKAEVNQVSFTGPEPIWEDEDDIVSNLTCICIVGIEDPVRPEVPAAIKQCQRAGITVRMCTGDNVNTARSIATKCGIISPGDGGLILEGKEFNKLIRDEDGEVSQKLLDKVWPSLRVLARSSPTDKYILVGGMIASKITANQEVVAVTGDGTNDGPALKKADVGFAMGITGTDVAKEASDIILTDDNFSSIVKAVVWGRKVYDSIAKFLQFQLTVNVVAVVVAVAGAVYIGSSPLKPVQMLWINLIMDTLASLALATELPTPDLLLRKPYGRTKSLISVTMGKSMVGQAIYQLAVIFVILTWGDVLFDIDNGTTSGEPNTHLTMVFNSFVMMTLFNEINCRKIHGQRNIFEGFFKNKWFCIIWLGTFLAQIILVEAWKEGFGKAFFTCPLEPEYWMWCLAFGFGSVAWSQLVLSIPSAPIGRLLERYRAKCQCKKKRISPIKSEGQSKPEIANNKTAAEPEQQQQPAIAPAPIVTPPPPPPPQPPSSPPNSSSRPPPPPPSSQAPAAARRV